jgi:hypothetical protein
MPAAKLPEAWLAPEVAVLGLGLALPLEAWPELVAGAMLLEAWLAPEGQELLGLDLALPLEV